MGKIRNAAVFVLVALGVLVWMSTFIVRQWERAVVFRLGEIISADYDPGLHFKWPIDNVRKFDARILPLDVNPESYFTSEKKSVIVDSFVKWRIKDVALFFRTSGGGDENRVAQLLQQRVDNGLRAEFAKRTIQDVVSGDRTQIMEIIATAANREGSEYGIEVVDVRVKRIEFPQDVSESVYKRMATERERVARDFRSRGAEAAERIRADADRQRTIVLAEAYRDAERIRGEGDAKAAAIYADAYRKNPEFYAFTRSLNSYRHSFRGQQDVLVLQPDSEFFKYFGQAEGKRR